MSDMQIGGSKQQFVGSNAQMGSPASGGSPAASQSSSRGSYVSARASQEDVYEPAAAVPASQGAGPADSQASQTGAQAESGFGPFEDQSSVASPVQSPISQTPISLTPIQLSPVQQYEAEAAAAVSSASSRGPVVAPTVNVVSFTPEAFNNGLMTGIANGSKSQFRALVEQLVKARVSRPVVENLLLPLKAAAMAPAPTQMQLQRHGCDSSVSGKALNRWAKAVLHATKTSRINDCNRLTALALLDETRALVDEAVCNGCIDHHWRLKRRSKKLAKRAKDLERSGCDTPAPVQKGAVPRSVPQQGAFKRVWHRCAGVFKRAG
ncbi:MAG TPA: hypothetical protein VFH51_08210 [Myxococcota bacterium]|nr:hypothetical protein [Myxococcota bacterium]